MKRLMLSVVALAALSGSALFAQDVTGAWQGTLQADKGLRTVVKISKADHSGMLPGSGFGPTPGGVRMRVNNATLADFSHSMQAAVLDRPVLDQTGLAGRYDFNLSWAPDESQFGGHFPGGRSDDQNPPENPLPRLFTAIQEQIGLKLEPTKAPVDVMVIDHVEKPSEN